MAKIEFLVTRDQGYGRCFCRVYDTREEAEAGMAQWKREGIGHMHPSLQLGGDWYIQERAA